MKSAAANPAENALMTMTVAKAGFVRTHPRAKIPAKSTGYAAMATSRRTGCRVAAASARAAPQTAATEAGVAATMVAARSRPEAASFTPVGVACSDVFPFAAISSMRARSKLKPPAFVGA